MYRNPSPPPQEPTEHSVDRIGNTAYSQCWVLKALVDLASQKLKEDEELPEEQENMFCQLWDMSSDKHVGQFMLEKGVCDLMLAPLVRSTNFRVREVSLGIIANLVCHKSSAKVVTDHETLRTFLPTFLKEDDVSVLTETVRLLRAALTHDSSIYKMWYKVLPEDVVERLIHIIQSTLTMTSMRSTVLKEHCSHMLETLYYRDNTLLFNSAYTVFPIVDILQHRNSRDVEEPLLRCLQYLSEEKKAVINMTQCPGLSKVLYRVMSDKTEYGLTAVCLSLICTLLTSPTGTDEMCAWLEKDCTITNTAIRTLNRILQDDREEPVAAEPAPSSQDRPASNHEHNNTGSVRSGPATPPNHNEVEVPAPENGGIETPTPKTSDKLAVRSCTPVRLVTPTYGTPSAVPTPHSAGNTPQSTLSTPYSLQRRIPCTPLTDHLSRVRHVTAESSRPIISVCREMAWNFLYTLANHIPQEGSCVLRYISDDIKDIISCFQAESDKHVELAMLYKQHLEKYPHFSKSSSLLDRYITQHTVIPDP